MAGIQTSVSVRDGMSAQFATMTRSINVCLGAFMDMQQATGQAVNTTAMNAARDAMQEMNVAAKDVTDSIRESEVEQEKLNNTARNGTDAYGSMLNKVKGIVAAYVSWHAVGSVVKMSDELTNATARINMMNDGMQTTNEVMKRVYNAAQSARGSYTDMADMVAKLGNNARAAFASTNEIVDFAELVQKSFTIAGASTTEASNAMLQLTQAMGSGVLRGDELNSIFEQAPNIIQNVADYMNVPIGKIREMASEGQITADIVKNAMFAASDDINSKMEAMPTTWAQVAQGIQNQALETFQPILAMIGQITSNSEFQTVVSGITSGFQTLAAIATPVINGIINGASYIINNWSSVSPYIYGVVAAIGALCAIQATYNAIHAITNAAWLASPITWIIMGIVAIATGVVALCNHIAQMGGTATTAFGVMTGGISVVGAFFTNLWEQVKNIAFGIWNAMCACASNIQAAFHNAIVSVQSWFYNLMSTALTVISNICAALNQLPFVTFDYSGITSKAQEYANKAADAAGSKEAYQDVGAAFSEGMGTYDTFSAGWATDAYNTGAAWGDGVVSKITDKISGFKDSISGLGASTGLGATGYGAATGADSSLANGGAGGSGGLGDIAKDTGNIASTGNATAANTAKIADSMETAEENLEWLKDIAERDIIDRTVFTKVEVNMGGISNNVNNMTDLDAIPEYINNALQQQLAIGAEG